MGKMKSVAFWGCGNLAGIIADNLGNGIVTGYKLLGACGSRPDSADGFAVRYGCTAFDSIEALIAAGPDIIIEATNPACLRKSGVLVPENGIDLIPLSTGAFADEAFLRDMESAAERGNARVLLPAGAVGGMDLVCAARMMGDLHTRIVNEKPPAALRGAPFLQGRTLSGEKREELFRGTAAQAISNFPQNLNVAVTTALAGSGMEESEVVLVSDPGLDTNVHRIELEGEFGRATVDIASRPSRGNAKSSELAAWSVLYMLRKMQQRIVFY